MLRTRRCMILMIMWMEASRVSTVKSYGAEEPPQYIKGEGRGSFAICVIGITEHRHLLWIGC